MISLPFKNEFFGVPPCKKNAEIMAFMSVLRLSKAINSSKQSGVIFTFSKPCKFRLFFRVEITTLRKFTILCDEFDGEF